MRALGSGPEFRLCLVLGPDPESRWYDFFIPPAGRRHGGRRQENHFAARRAGARSRSARQGRGQDPERGGPGRVAPCAHRPAPAGAARHAGILEPQGARSRHPQRAGPRALPALLRVVFDTNVLVTALVFPGGHGEAALRRIIEERDELVLSKSILDELLGVLARKFSRDAEELAHVAVFLGELATVVRPARRLKVLKDDPDNRVLECAVAGRANVIVTGDRALLTLGEYRGVRVVSLRDYLGL